MMNTFLPHKMTYNIAKNPVNSRMKPESVLLYNKTMGAIDAMDKTIKPFSNHRKTFKWYKKVFFYLIDVALFNSYKAYQFYHRSSKFSVYKDFVLNVIEKILEENPDGKIGRKQTISAPKESAYHISIWMGRSDCVLCKRTGGIRSQTQYKCSAYQVRLCLQKGPESCYSRYHDDLLKVINF